MKILKKWQIPLIIKIIPYFESMNSFMRKMNGVLDYLQPETVVVYHVLEVEVVLVGPKDEVAVLHLVPLRA